MDTTIKRSTKLMIFGYSLIISGSIFSISIWNYFLRNYGLELIGNSISPFTTFILFLFPLAAGFISGSGLLLYGCHVENKEIDDAKKRIEEEFYNRQLEIELNLAISREQNDIDLKRSLKRIDDRFNLKRNFKTLDEELESKLNQIDTELAINLEAIRKKRKLSQGEYYEY